MIDGQGVQTTQDTMFLYWNQFYILSNVYANYYNFALEFIYIILIILLTKNFGPAGTLKPVIFVDEPSMSWLGLIP